MCASGTLDPAAPGTQPGAGRQAAAAPERARRSMAYREIAHELVRRITVGEIAGGDRLPGEIELAEEFGVSRATVREALRLLDAQDLIDTRKGASGGSFVRVPRVSRINELLFSSIELLASAHHVTLDDLLEARELIEVPAARIAAARRTQADVERLHESIPAAPATLSRGELFTHNRDFHTTVIETSGNVLLTIAAQPVFDVLMANVARDTLSARFSRHVAEQHTAITRAIVAGDAEAAGDLMHEHLAYLRPAYTKAWRAAARSRS